VDFSIEIKTPGLTGITAGTALAKVVLSNVGGCPVPLSVAPQTPSLCTLLASAVRSADQNVSMEEKSLQKASGF